MLLSLTLVLILSSAAMILLLYAKHWELTTGRILFPNARPKIASYAHRALFAVERELPALLKSFFRTGLRWLRTRARDLLARAWIATEQELERMLYKLKHGLAAARRGGAPTENIGQASAFLREVAEHKRKLVQLTRPRRTKKIQEISLTETKNLDTSDKLE